MNRKLLNIIGISYIFSLLTILPLFSAENSSEIKNYDQELLSLMAKMKPGDDDEFRTVIKFLKDGANPNIQDEKGKTALMYAAELGSRYLVFTMVNKNNGDISIADKSGKTILMAAAASGEPSIFEDLLKRTNGLENKLDNEGNHLIYYALRGARRLEDTNHLPNRTETILLLLNMTSESSLFKFDPLHLDSNGNSLLHLAAKYFNPLIIGSILKLIPESKRLVEINRRNYNLQTPLMLAAGAINEDAVRYLLLEGADVNLFDTRNQTALIYAFYAEPSTAAVVSQNSIESIISVLLEAKADPNMKIGGDEGMPILHRSVSIKNHKLVMALLNAGADPNQVDYAKQNALHIAAYERDPVSLQILLPRMKDLQAKDITGQTVFDIVEKIDNSRVVEKAALKAVLKP